jgi:hypothetical protein
MMPSETFYVDVNPIGRIVIDTNSQENAFLPAITSGKLPMQGFESVDELRNAVIAAYQNKEQETRS